MKPRTSPTLVLENPLGFEKPRDLAIFRSSPPIALKDLHRADITQSPVVLTSI